MKSSGSRRKPPLWVTDKKRKKCISQCCNRTAEHGSTVCITCRMWGTDIPYYKHVEKIQGLEK